MTGSVNVSTTVIPAASDQDLAATGAFPAQASVPDQVPSSGAHWQSDNADHTEDDADYWYEIDEDGAGQDGAGHEAGKNHGDGAGQDGAGHEAGKNHGDGAGHDLNLKDSDNAGLNLNLKDDDDEGQNLNLKDDTGHEDDEDDLPPRINDPDSLRNGIVKTSDKKADLTLLLVGETGVGKTSVLSLIANVLAGNKPDEYVDVYDPTNEEGGSQSQSQTNLAKVYEFKSKNGITIHILDTPGLADTRGIAQDELHKESIAKAIQEHIVTVNGVLILANGTVPRLGAATDYALSTLSSIFPRSLVDNIAFMFTNVSSPLSWNFEHSSLPTVLQNADQFLLDNPIAMQKKYNELKQEKLPKATLKQLRDGVKQGELTALDKLSDLFDWLDKRVPQPTNDILSLYEQSQTIEKSIQNALARMQQANTKRNDLEKIKRDIDKAKLDIDTLKDFEKVIKRKRHIQAPMTYHSTLCSVPDCYGNCHRHCGLTFSLDPSQLAGCTAMQPGGDKCAMCEHKRDDHRHYNTLWEEVEEDERVVDKDAEKKYQEATSEKDKKEAMKERAQKAIDQLTNDVDEGTIQLGRLAEEYANLSLSGSFASQVEKAIKLMELNIEKMRNDGSDPEMIRKLEKSMASMQEKLRVLREARQKAREKSNIVTFAKDTGKKFLRFVGGRR